MFDLHKFINNIFFKRKVYLISDTHFNHENIIKYCCRPFESVEQMNEALVHNWNKNVKKHDVVYFLGDWGTGHGHHPLAYWKEHLNGKIISIKGFSTPGRHSDKYGLRHQILKSKKHIFLLIHDPNNKLSWNDWIIHGHVHNSQLDKYPFINGYRKTINVSVELTDYRPVSLDWLESLNLDEIRWMRTSSSTPERW
jgi:calcineurin-like phosphoesterase family protein